MKHAIAIPLENGQLSIHFGHCRQFALVEVENNSIISKRLMTPPPHEPGLFPEWLAKQGVTEVIAAGIGQRAVNLLMDQNIKVNAGAQPKSPEALISDWLENSLVTGNNCCDH